MWAHVMLVATFFPAGVQSFSPAPLQLGGPASGRFVLASAPKASTSGANLIVGSTPSKVSSNVIPDFAAKFDSTITWDAMGWCIEAYGDNLDVVRLSDCTGASNQKWNWLPMDDGQSQIQLKGTNKCLDVIDSEGALNGVPVVLQACGSKDTELWKFAEPAPLPIQQSTLAALISMAAFGAISLSAWFWRLQSKAMQAALSQGGAPFVVDQGGVCLTEPLAVQRSDVTMQLQLEKEKVAEQPPLAPLTIWGDRIADIREAQATARSKKHSEFPKTVRKSDVLPDDADEKAELAWMAANAQELKDDMERCGAVVFRGFSAMKEQAGFEAFYKAIGMNPCLDPLHTVSARPTADGSKTGAVYEAVNKESRKNFFIGLHNEFVGTRAPRAAAFVCFKAAEEGGEFIIADGRAVFRDLDSDVLENLYRKNIRYSVMELPFFGWVDKLPEPVQSPAMGFIRGLASTAINLKVDFSVDILEQRGGYDNTRLLQARAPSQVPILNHPVTGEPTWFCNVHSHSSKLRKAREEIYGAERFEDGASKINKSDMFYGDDQELSDADLKHLDDVTQKNLQYIKMSEGDVVLLDNYKTMHGRNVFDGTRKHAVCWFGGWDGEDEQRSRQWNL